LKDLMRRKDVFMSTRPRLRHVEAFPVQQNGTQGIALRDPFRYTEGIIFVPVGLLPLVQLMDGTRDLGDIQAEVMRQYGQLVQEEELRGLVDTLDRNHYLDSENFATYKKEIETRYLDSPVRPPYLAGQAYPTSREELDRLFDGFFHHPDGPGVPDRSKRSETPAGAIIPHIDFGRGGPVYAHAYHSLVESKPADVYLILGTSHMGTRQPFSLTRKDFDTPFGKVPSDVEFIDELVEEVGDGFFEDELSHRAEHSIEFQVVLLHRLIGQDHPVSIVPILCGSLRELVLNGGGSPMEKGVFSGFVEGLSKTLAKQKKKVCAIASVDLAHVGPQFGDPEPVNESKLAEIEQKDNDMLERVREGDAEGFFRYVQGEKDQRNVCGLTPIYTLLTALKGRKVDMLKYAAAPDPQGTVTFASLLIH
jgi:AmmeMemoRadiSam system protein B